MSIVNMFRRAWWTFVVYVAPMAVMAQNMEPGDRTQKMVSATNLLYLGLASFVTWLVIFAIVVMTYRSQSRLAQRLVSLEKELK